MGVCRQSPPCIIRRAARPHTGRLMAQRCAEKAYALPVLPEACLPEGVSGADVRHIRHLTSQMRNGTDA
eukprot:1157390-Pelagomonas_calceolata.AAC.5